MENWYKANFDAALFEHLGMAGLGVVFSGQHRQFDCSLESEDFAASNSGDGRSVGSKTSSPISNRA